MKIERINETTFKLFVSYEDIEERGFKREEIMTSRERGEELFWDIMDDARHEGIEIRGPVWLQVKMLEIGIEILISCSDSKGRHIIPVPKNEFSLEGFLNMFENLVENENVDLKVEEKNEQPTTLQYIFRFEQLDDVISLAYTVDFDYIDNELYLLDKYYLVVDFSSDETDEFVLNTVQRIVEYGNLSKYTIHRLKEYGKLIADQNAILTFKKYF